MAPKIKPPAKPRRFLKAKLIAAGVVLLAGFIAVEAGWAGYGFAHLVAKVFPRDESILGWVPPDASFVAIVDPHQIDRASLPPSVTSAMDRLRADVDKSMGMDLGFALDKLAITPSLAVGDGRFDEKKLAEKLRESHYEEADHLGVAYFTKKGEDAIAVIADKTLLYGDEPSVVSAIDAHDTRQSLEQNEQVLDRLKQVGWSHAVIFTDRVRDDKPSVRAVLSGDSGPLGVSGAIGTKLGLDLVLVVDMPSPSAAEEAKKTWDQKRSDAKALEPTVGADLAALLADVGKRATLTQSGNTLTALVHVDAATFDKAIEGAKKSPAAAEAMKSTKLLQLLGGS